MNCHNCGSHISAENKFCSNCGSSCEVQPNNVIRYQFIPNQDNNIKKEVKEKVKIKISKRNIFLLFSITLFCISAYFLFNLSKSEINTSGTRTIMIYMVGSDLESKYGYASSDIKEMLRANPNLLDNNIIIYTGGSKNWSNDFVNNAIYEMNNNEFKLIKQDKQLSMAKDTTLTSFIDYVYENYESDLYSLFFWNHGAGPILGFGSDELDNKNALELAEIDLALKNTKLIKNTKFELIGFDACLMASVEVASILSNYANYLVSSQDTEPGFGWDYAFLKEINRETNSIEFGKSIIDNFYKFYELLGYDNYVPLTLSLVDLNKISKIEEKINKLFVDVDTTLTNGGYSAIVNQITKSKCFQCQDYDSSFDLIDLYGAVSELKTNYNDKANDLIKSLDDTILYQKTNVNGANGLSIYYPYYTKKYLSNWLTTYNNLNFAKEYQTFINNYTKTLLGDKITEFDFKNIVPTISENQNNISIQLDKKTTENYHQGKYIIFKDMKDGYYTPVFSSTDTTLKEDGTLIANFKKQELNIIGEDSSKNWIIANEYERTKDYVIYQIMVLLSNYDVNIDISNWEKLSASILLKVDARHPNGQVIGIIPNANINDNSSIKKSIDLAEWKTIEFWNYRYKIFDQNNNFTWDWIGASSEGGTLYGYEVNTTENYSIKFNDLENGYDYFAIFVVNDTQGNEYITNPVKIES